MTEAEFDRCPECGAFPQYGLRCHPKYSVKVGLETRNGLDLVAYYAHDEASFEALVRTFQNDGFSDVVATERWNSDSKMWVDHHV